MFSEKNAKLGVTFPKGFSAAGVKAGIKKSGNPDLAVIYTKTEAVVAGTFTQNQVAAAPVFASKKVVATGTAHAVVSNSGCANACTGAVGDADAKKTQEVAAAALGCDPLDVIVGSTGVIGVPLPMNKVEAGVKQAVSELDPEGSEKAANAIITTDTHTKSCSTTVNIGGKDVRFGAIAKGSGMIRPNMATMLCYITTDLAIDQKLLQEALSTVVETTFNMISIDGDMSTNDMVIVMANGEAGNAKITEKGADYDKVVEVLHAISEGCQDGRHGRCEQPARQDGVLWRRPELGPRHLRCRLCRRPNGSRKDGCLLWRHPGLCAWRRRECRQGRAREGHGRA